MNLQRSDAWKRRGCSLLWDAAALAKVAAPAEVISIRQFFALARSWPEELPGAGGTALVVAGVEGCLDALSGADGCAWLEADLKPAVLRFQDEYEGQAALILWLPSGRSRISMVTATEEYVWKDSRAASAGGLPLGRCLWAGAESDAARIIVSDAPQPNVDGPAWAGLYHPRLS